LILFYYHLIIIVMSQVNRTTLKSYLETGDIPTQAEFVNLVDSFLSILDDGCLVGGENNITAHAGGGSFLAYALTKKCNRVSTVASAGDSIKLPSGYAGMSIYICNVSGTSCDCFPAAGGYIDSLPVDTAVSIGGAEFPMFFCYADKKWKMILY
jgi:hypothetical protein